MKIVTLSYLIAVLWQASAKAPVVKTPLGKIEGMISEFDRESVKIFAGIPYTTPPLESLRFLKPEPVEAWDGVLQAKKQRPACMQYTEAPFPWYDVFHGTSEDCLYLNIYTPFFANKESKLAVLFWIHGGGFTLGSNAIDAYDGKILAQREGVIVVTIQYRLGLFGFLTSNTSNAPGNVGMYDVVMALEWVHDNIEYFGGDKDRITISGEGEGSITVSILCVSPLTKGLFSRAIMESGSIIKLKYNMLDYNMDLSERLAEAVDCANDDSTIYDNPDDVVKCLRDRNATYLTKTLWSFNRLSMTSFFPQYGDDLLPNNALDDIRDGNFHNVSILVGVVSDEGSFFLSTEHPDKFGFFGKKNPKINKKDAKTLLESTFSNFTDPKKYIDFYLKDISDKKYDLIRRQVYTASGDTNILCPTIFFAESYAKRNNDVFYYFFTHRPSDTLWAKWMGVVHFEEVQFVFGRPLEAAHSIWMKKVYSTKEVWLSKEMMEIWANFAKDGRPAHPDMYPKWKKYTKENHSYLTIDIKNYGKHGTGPHLKNCNFLRDHFGFSSEE